MIKDGGGSCIMPYSRELPSRRIKSKHARSHKLRSTATKTTSCLSQDNVLKFAKRSGSVRKQAIENGHQYFFCRRQYESHSQNAEDHSLELAPLPRMLQRIIDPQTQVVGGDPRAVAATFKRSGVHKTGM